MPTPADGRQVNLEFEPQRLEGLDDPERRKAVSTLAQILMQAAGLMVEKLSNDRHCVDPGNAPHAQGRRLSAPVDAVARDDHPGEPTAAT